MFQIGTEAVRSPRICSDCHFVVTDDLKLEMRVIGDSGIVESLLVLDLSFDKGEKVLVFERYPIYGPEIKMSTLFA